MKRFINIADFDYFPAAVADCVGRDSAAHGAWTEEEFEHRPLFAYPAAAGQGQHRRQSGQVPDSEGRHAARCRPMVRRDGQGNLQRQHRTSTGGRLRPAGQIILPDEHILPDTPRVGIVLNIPEMRLYYYYPSPTGPSIHKPKGKVTPAKFVPGKKHSGGVRRRRWCTPSRSVSAVSIGRLRSGRFTVRAKKESDLGGSRRHLQGASRA